MTCRRCGARGATNRARGHAATDTHLRAVGTINEMFDRLDDLTAGRDRLTRAASREADGDPIEDVEALLEHAWRVGAALDALRAAAHAASAHRPRGEPAADVGTKDAALFPQRSRQLGYSARPSSAPTEQAASGDGAEQGSAGCVDARLKRCERCFVGVGVESGQRGCAVAVASPDHADDQRR